MVQPNKIGIKSHHLKLDTQSFNLKPSFPSSSPPSSSSSQTHEKLKKIMKKSRSIKRPDESPFRKKKPPPLINEPGSAPTTPQKTSPNYMKSTSSFEARKEQSTKTPASKGSKTKEAASAVKGSRTSSLKKVRTLTKTPSFKPLRSAKKVILCEDVDAQRATCSSTLKESKFPDYLELNPGGSEVDGTSAMKVCPYSYCSLNGHHHAPVQPLKCFLSARRRGLKTQKGFKLGYLSPRQTKPNVKKIDVKEPLTLKPEEVDMKEENKDFFIDIYSKDLEGCDIDWEEGNCFDAGDDGLKLQGIDGGVGEDEMEKKTGLEGFYDEHQDLYDEESVSSGAWTEEDGDSASDSSCEQMKMNQDYVNYDAFEVKSTAESEESDGFDEVEGLNGPIGNQNIDYQEEETVHESKAVPDFAETSRDEDDKNRTTIIYNIIQFNISVFVNGEKTDHSGTDKTVTVPVNANSVAADKMETEEAMEEQCMRNEDDEASEVNQMDVDEDLPFNVQEIASTEQLNAIEKQDDTVQECNEKEAPSQSNSMDAVTNMDEEPAIRSDVDQTHGTGEITSETDKKTNSFGKMIVANDELPDPCINLRGCRKPGEETGDDSWEFNPRGPNFLPETPDPDAETVDLRHQEIDERKNAEEWMVDFALQQAVTKLAPARKKKVALLVEAFEKVSPVPVPARNPIPMYEPHNRHASKAFTNSRPMQACS